jgi:hypothetical protein
MQRLRRRRPHKVQVSKFFFSSSSYHEFPAPSVSRALGCARRMRWLFPSCARPWPGRERVQRTTECRSHPTADPRAMGARVRRSLDGSVSSCPPQGPIAARGRGRDQTLNLFPGPPTNPRSGRLVGFPRFLFYIENELSGDREACGSIATVRSGHGHDESCGRMSR